MGPEVLILTAMFATIFGCVYVIVTSRHRQRMALIEKGMDASLLVTPKTPRKDLMLSLMFGMLMVGLGVGILFGYLLNLSMPMPPTEYNAHPENEAFYFLSILICGGVALIGHHFIVRNKRQG